MFALTERSIDFSRTTNALDHVESSFDRKSTRAGSKSIHRELIETAFMQSIVSFFMSWLSCGDENQVPLEMAWSFLISSIVAMDIFFSLRSSGNLKLSSRSSPNRGL